MTGWNPKRKLPKDWPARVRRVFKLKGRVCALQLSGVCTGQATEVDHIDSNTDHRIENLQPVCSECHDVKTKEQSRVATRARADLLHPRSEKHPGLL